MDEVDGMAGNEDKGGMAALIDVIKTTKIPIICICNERSHPKIKSLLKSCYEIKYVKPEKRQIINRLVKIKTQEKLNISNSDLDSIAESAQGDLRFAVNLLEAWGIRCKANLSKVDGNVINKDLTILLNPFEAAKKLLNKFEFGKLDISTILSLYFVDSDLVPGLIQENYLNPFIQNRAKSIKEDEELERIIEISENISFSDILENKIQRDGQWNLLVDKGIHSCYSTSYYNIGADNYPKFPESFSFFSKKSKKRRMVQELKKSSGNLSNDLIVSQFCPIILNLICDKLLQADSKSGIASCLELMVENKIDIILLKENIFELSEERAQTRFGTIGSSIKSAFTRAYNEKFRVMRKTAKGKGKKNLKPNIESEDDDTDTIVEEGGELIENED